MVLVGCFHCLVGRFLGMVGGGLVGWLAVLDWFGRFGSGWLPSFFRLVRLAWLVW